MLKTIASFGRIATAMIGLAAASLASANIGVTGQDMELTAAHLQREIGMAQWLGDAAYWLWLSCGFAGIIAYCWISYRLIRRLLGHRRFRKSWYTEAEYRQLLQEIRADYRRGLPLHDDELQAIHSSLGNESKLGIGET